MPASENDPRSKFLKEITFMPSSIETIDTALYTQIDEEWNLHATTNKGWRKVPVIWVGAERAFQVKANKEIRDSEGMLKLPLITIERVSMDKDPARRGIAPANILPWNDHQGGSIVVARRIEQTETAKHVNARASRKVGTLASQHIGDGLSNTRDLTRPKVANMFDVGPGNPGDKTVYETISIPMPAYVTVGYKITIQTEYQQQMNDIITPFISKTGNARIFMCQSDGHRYEAFIETSFGVDNNIATLEEEDRSFKSTIDIKVEGYLIGDGPNQERPRIVKRQSALLAIASERTVISGVEFPEKFVQTSSPSVIASVIQHVLHAHGGGTDTSQFIKLTDYVVGETPSGAMNGSNTTFTLAAAARDGTVSIQHNGLTLKEGSDSDFTVSSQTITMAEAPEDGDNLIVNYVKRNST
ncbi:MAG: hypothetical protein CMQ51_05550 [Gammaproteobacteria bacterium]|nr:hypothetical protein [Gammaproteobacteria bacterium]|tara:strand:- start:894 stop:2135 length:1242 start_codon:yes stop_codon:yes gene_type:complete